MQSEMDIIANNIIYNDFYYLAIIVNFLAFYRLVIRDIIKSKKLIFRDLILIISSSILFIAPIINEALAITLFTYGYFSGLSMFEYKVIFDFNKSSNIKKD